MPRVFQPDHFHTQPGPSSVVEATGHDQRRAEHFLLLFDNTPDGITLLDPSADDVSWPIVECNRAFCQMNGYPREELVGQSIDVVHPKPDPAGKRDGYLQQMRTDGTFHIEALHRRKDGTLFTIEAAISLIEIDGQEYVIGVDRDITAKKQAEQAANRQIRDLELDNRTLEMAIESASSQNRQTLEHLQAIFQYSPNAILLMAPDGTMRTANPAFLELFNTTLDEITGKSPVHFVTPPYKSHILIAAQQVRNSRQPTQFEIAFQVDDDDWRDIAVALAPIQEGEDLLGLVCNLWDITAFKEIERLKDAILAVAAHELRTPLTSVLGFSEILLTRSMDEASHNRYLGLINAQAQHLKQLINDLLDVSRLHDGEDIWVESRPVDICRLVSGVAIPAAEQYSDHVIDIGSIPSIEVCGDPVRLEQVVTNLLSNAVKYSPPGSPIQIDGRVVDGFFQLAFRDQGIGMTTDQQKRIFERFYRADASNSAPSGVGLGLTICHMIVSAHGGFIAVESTPGQGSTFTVNLPLLPTI